MRRVFLFLLIIISYSFIRPQEIIENPEKPLSRNAGRVLKLKEVIRITDKSVDYYFKYPGDLKVAHDGCIFFRDEEQILKFSPEGEFIRNYFKKGQGPGEISGWNYPFALFKDEIYVYDSNPRKIIHFDKGGDLIEEFSFKSEDYRNLYGVLDGSFIFIKNVYPSVEERKSRLHDVKHIIFLVSNDGKVERENSVFPVKQFLGQNYGKGWAPFDTVISEDNKRLYIYHTCEYMIDLLDIKKGEVIRSFNRKYPRVKYTIKYPDEEEFAKKYNAPIKKFEDDISDLYICKGFLWIKTSTKDKNKGDLFDVFNEEEQYIDNFYINLKGSLMGVHEDSIFVLETDEDENLQIVKYKIIDGIKIPQSPGLPGLKKDVE
ncbi:MAG: hypothetical protein OEY25_02780 [Candidatus Aminicenantes bacterium]|nr:hypothetical protein [Candidatus Aminicenantes bacterium]MDH5706356.1 hypothetical protein [Candidatus Aminicenantes bacterium]